ELDKPLERAGSVTPGSRAFSRKFPGSPVARSPLLGGPVGHRHKIASGISSKHNGGDEREMGVDPRHSGDRQPPERVGLDLTGTTKLVDPKEVVGNGQHKDATGKIGREPGAKG